jgi:hypothetical protein
MPAGACLVVLARSALALRPSHAATCPSGARVAPRKPRDARSVGGVGGFSFSLNDLTASKRFGVCACRVRCIRAKTHANAGSAPSNTSCVVYDLLQGRGDARLMLGRHRICNTGCQRSAPQSRA